MELHFETLTQYNYTMTKSNITKPICVNLEIPYHEICKTRNSLLHCDEHFPMSQCDKHPHVFHSYNQLLKTQYVEHLPHKMSNISQRFIVMNISQHRIMSTIS